VDIKQQVVIFQQTDPDAITVHAHCQEETCSSHQWFTMTYKPIVEQRRLEYVPRQCQRYQWHPSTLSINNSTVTITNSTNNLKTALYHNNNNNASIQLQTCHNNEMCVTEHKVPALVCRHNGKHNET